jgi:hydroxymethylglutaryl-CoA lyase
MVEDSTKVRVVEVGPRDGLQNESDVIRTSAKVEFIQRLVKSGLQAIETTSFVRPDRVPQMADAAEVMRTLGPGNGVDYITLVPNEKGLQLALEAGVRHIALFTGASEQFTKKNINMTIDESLDRFDRVAGLARAEGLSIRGYVSCCFGCPYQGQVEEDVVVRVAERLLEAGCYEVSYGDTIGVGVPTQVASLSKRLVEGFGAETVAMHLHDTRGTALANVVRALDEGVRTFDASAAGLGGCPYAPGASGNLATEDLLYLLHGMGYETGVRLEDVIEASRYLSEVIGRLPPGRVFRAMTALK